jgi:hypothetical protein
MHGSWLRFLAIPIFIYLGAPILIRFTQKMAAQPRFYPLDTAGVPPDVLNYFYWAVEALRPVGFVPSAYVALPQQVPNVQAFLVMLVNPYAGDKAMVTAMYGTQSGVPRLSTRYLEFSTRYEDGRWVDTLNSKTLGSFKESPEGTKTQAPSVQDPQELYRLHQYVMAKAVPGGKKVLYGEGEAVPYLSRVMIESYDRQVKYGWLALERTGGVYRPTWLGAYMMTWGLLWPMTAIRRFRMEQKEREVLRAFRAELAAGRASAT